MTNISFFQIIILLFLIFLLFGDHSKIRVNINNIIKRFKS
jgi:Sec-independent protein translocase protein TatA